MRTFTFVVVLIAGLAGCSRGGGAGSNGSDVELADALAEADEATAVSFTGAPLAICELLSTAEVELAIGTLSAPARPLPEEATDSSEARCEWRGSEGRVLSLAGAREGAAERLAAIEPYTAADISGQWDQARLQGCCLLHASREEALLSLDFSSARLALEPAGKLMSMALARVHEPLETGPR